MVPDVYLRNQDLNDKVKFLQNEVHRYKNAAEYVITWICIETNSLFIFC